MKSICKKMISMLVAFALITGFVQVLPDAEAATKPTLTASASVNQGSATTLKVSFAAKNNGLYSLACS